MFQIHDFNTIENNFIQKFVTLFINVFFGVLIPLFLSYFLNSMLEKFYLITNYGIISNLWFEYYYNKAKSVAGYNDRTNKYKLEYDLLRDNLVRILLLIICAVIFSIALFSSVIQHWKYTYFDWKDTYGEDLALYDMLCAVFGLGCFWLAIILKQRRKILTRMKNEKDLLEALESLKVKLDPHEDGC